MNDPVLVTSFYPELIDKFRNRTLVVQTDRLEEVPEIYNKVNEYNGLLCINVRTDNALSLLNFHDRLAGIPIYLTCRGLGTFREFIRIKPILLKLNIKVFFKADNDENFTAVKILSSLGIHSGIILNPENDWDLAADLMTYAIYNKASHAPVEPFQYVLEHYDPQELLNVDHMYFDDPEHYLYIDKDFNIAVSERKLGEGKYIGQGIDTLKSLNDNPLYKQELKAWQKYFLKSEGCAYCKSWRVCMGKFRDSPENEGCINFFSDLMEAADENRKIKQQGR